MKVLVIGGAGYIGSFTVRALREAGYEIVIFDDFSQGHKEAVKGFQLVKGSLVEDRDLLADLLQKEKFAAVVHFAAFIQMGESYRLPEKYFRNNVVGSLNLLEATIKAGIEKFVFSSSAGVYGDPQRVPIKEEDRKLPTNPYGETKLIIEKMLFWFGKAYGLRSISLRYFNAAGAALDGSIGEDHPDESHLIRPRETPV
jgi:UDP-glucose 4-epimerase